MRLPRQDTSKSLPAEHPRDALARDEALLDEVPPLTRAESPPSRFDEVAPLTRAESPPSRFDEVAPLTRAQSSPSPRARGEGRGEGPLVRWWVPASPAIVIGLGLRHRLAEIVDLERCRAAGVEVLERRAGGGAVLLDQHMVCGAVCLPLPDPRAPDDLTTSYRWLGDLLAARLRALGIAQARPVDLAEARADVAQLKSSDDAVARILLTACYGALSPYEVVVGRAKLVGLAQIRRRHGALFQFGILLRDQSPLADYLSVPDEPTRENLRDALRQRTIGLDSTSPAVARLPGEVTAALTSVEPDQLL